MNLQAAVNTMNIARDRYAVSRNSLAWLNGNIAHADATDDKWAMHMNRTTRSLCFSNMNRYRNDLRKAIKCVEALRIGVVV